MKEPRDIERGGEVEVGDEELARVDALLAALPAIEPRPGVVREVVMRVEASGARRPVAKTRRAGWFWGLATASGAVAAALIAVAGGRRADLAPAPMQEAQAPSSVVTKNQLALLEESESTRGEVLDRPARVQEKRENKEDPGDDGGRFRVQVERGGRKVDLLADGDLANARDLAGLVGGKADFDRHDELGKDTTLYWKRGFLDVDEDAVRSGDEEGQNVLRVPAAQDQPPPEVVSADPFGGFEYEVADERAREQAGRDGKTRAPSDPARGPVVASRLDESTVAGNTRVPEEEAEETPKQEVEADETDGRKSLTQSLSLSSTSAPSFIEPRGYFANTYLPGDAELSWLRAQVAAGLSALGGLSLEALVAPVAQPFDAPRDGALGLHLASDVAALGGDTEGPRRVTLQLGLKGARQAPTRRSAVNLALVVDVASIADENERRALWALAESVIGQAQPEDRVTMVVHTGQTERAPEVVRVARGEVSRVLAEAYEVRGGERALIDAVSTAYGAVREGAREDAAMGSELVVLVTPTLAGVEPLAERAHLEALGGVHLSAVGVGKRVDLATLRMLALAGQGRASHVMAAAEADGVVGAELSAAGRVVARAVRLRVKLGDGVKLVSVLGSRRLDTRDADKVRAAEKRIDLEVEKTTGISADRGTDEDGIQIVIPAFMAGDDHVILFDVVVEKPGLVMDVRVRFKDLVSLGNGEVSASLTLPSGASGRVASGREQVNVTRNLAARRTSDALMLAASGLRAGDVRAARGALVSGRAEVERIAVRSGLDKDSVLGSDLRLLDAFERALDSPEGLAQGPLESALRLAARLELGAR